MFAEAGRSCGTRSPAGRWSPAVKFALGCWPRVCSPTGWLT